MPYYASPLHAFIITSTCFLTQRNHRCIYKAARSPSFFSSKVDALQNDGILHHLQLKRNYVGFFGKRKRQHLPRTKISRYSRLTIILRRFLLEVSLVSIAIAVASNTTIARIECTKFVIVNWILRYMTMSVFLKLCIVQSHLTSIAALEKDNWFIPGCFHLLLLHDPNKNNDTQLSSSSSVVPVRIRQVQGNGSCLFQAIAAGILFDEINNVQLLQQSKVVHYSLTLRELAVNTLRDGIDNNTSIITTNGGTITTVQSLVSNAASLYGMTCNNYLSEMQQVNVWGGGPEIVALAHYLQRQIVVLETYSGFTSSSDDEQQQHDVIYLKEMTRFGPPTSLNPIFILAASERFPKDYGNAKYNHYLAVFPTYELKA
jgi:hypothetical protein